MYFSDICFYQLIINLFMFQKNVFLSDLLAGLEVPDIGCNSPTLVVALP